MLREQHEAMQTTLVSAEKRTDLAAQPADDPTDCEHEWCTGPTTEPLPCVECFLTDRVEGEDA